MTRQNLELRVTRAAAAALAEHRFVSAIDVLVGLGWLAPSHVDQWRPLTGPAPQSLRDILSRR